MSLKNAIGGISLIAGTAIGAAVLALPVATAHLGLMQTLIIYLLCWTFMTLGALYLLEANLAMGYDTNLISMAEKTLGGWGKYATWVIYLVLLYALTAAYLTGAGAWIQQGIAFFDIHLSALWCAICATLLTVVVIYFGTAVTDWVNRIFMIALLGTFSALLVTTSPHIELNLLMPQISQIDLRPISLIITAFGFAIIVPTLTSYLHGNGRQLLSVILIGSLIPLLTYIVWEIAILGVLPLEGPDGLLAIQKEGHPATTIPMALQAKLGKPFVTKMAAGFSIFALVTSLLGVCLSLFDFLADGMHLHKNLREKSVLAIATFLPPLIFILFFPEGFTFALQFGGLFVALLLGILPAVMVWQLRYHSTATPRFRIWGGKPLLIATILFFLTVVCIEGYSEYEAFKNHLH